MANYAGADGEQCVEQPPPSSEELRTYWAGNRPRGVAALRDAQSSEAQPQPKVAAAFPCSVPKQAHKVHTQRKQHADESDPGEARNHLASWQ